MNEKVTLQQLADLLAQRRQMEQKDAEAFVRVFFALAEEALSTDRYIKIKGLGVFKRIGADACGSVVSFEPDMALREAVNKPFSQFEPVPLKEGVHFADTPEVGGAPERVESDGQEARSETVEECREESRPSSSFEAERIEETDRPALEESDRKVAVLRMPWCMIASVLMAGVLAGGAIVWALMSRRNVVTETAVEHVESPRTVGAGQEKADTSLQKKMIAEKYCSGEDTLRKQALPAAGVTRKKPEGQIQPIPAVRKNILSDSVRYVMTGTRTTYVLRRGESLARVARKFYGNKKLWPYLAKYNRTRISDPNNVPAGITLLIPELVPEQ